MTSNLQQRIVNSALWAAYGDILGFPTELVDASGVSRRIGANKISQPVKWSRMVGGKFGVWVDLEAGCYSDDTQLRIATSRSIRGDGHFDVETFAKVELPVWLSYSLGAGRGSKLGASTLNQRNVNWFSNFFEQRDVHYVNGGGNGAAMRVQPHVWASVNFGVAETYLPDAIRNALCTHGHPRGIAGAVVHAVCLASIFKNSRVPSPEDWVNIGLSIDLAFKFINEDPELNIFWLPMWHQKTSLSFQKEMDKVRIEWERDVTQCLPWLQLEPHIAYEKIVTELGGFDSDQRGSGIKCALFSLVAAWCFRGQGVDKAIFTVVNLLSSDTDTIGTMTGALLGAISDKEPLGKIQDREYIVCEAQRLFAIGQSLPANSFQYPDLLTWQGPKNQLDAVGIIQGKLAITGLGFAEICSDEFISNKGNYSYQWLKLSFGQKILCKRRTKILEMNMNSYPAIKEEQVHHASSNKIKKSITSAVQHPEHDLVDVANSYESRMENAQPSKLSSNDKKNKNEPKLKLEVVPSKHSLTLNELTDRAIKSGFDPLVIGQDLLDFAERSDGIELSIGYTSIIVKARLARLQRGRA